eukprot:1718129-Amphidinium_carterae.1
MSNLLLAPSSRSKFSIVHLVQRAAAERSKTSFTWNLMKTLASPTRPHSTQRASKLDKGTKRRLHGVNSFLLQVCPDHNLVGARHVSASRNAKVRLPCCSLPVTTLLREVPGVANQDKATRLDQEPTPPKRCIVNNGQDVRNNIVEARDLNDRDRCVGIEKQLHEELPVVVACADEMDLAIK